MADRNRSNPDRSAKTYLRVTTEEPSNEGGVWRITTTALASKSGRTLDGQEIQFFLDGSRYGSAVRTDADGRAQQTIEVPLGARRASVEAQAIGQPWVARDTVVFSTTPPVRSHSFEVHLIGGASGEYRIAGMVRTESEIPIKGARVRILNAADGKIVQTLRTDADGGFMLTKRVPDGEVLELEVWVSGLHAPNNPTPLRLVGAGYRSASGEVLSRTEPRFDLVGSFRRGRNKVGGTDHGTR
ncbi:MAG: hypothetical protein A3G58_01510 [Candidatus Colwellbacteria bacterium RIFCSPLOWO2_12_FULL_46_17]|uniref:Carboxypeptidase regulatory-like domain-containing protein n=1 Tax=Candidatus Colwellbacteria bacterium RIFCSPLOWO2_12_FULL_46_17 TaxID=1797695 RepID=A0A1G1ZD23_9BACT|nr:MAG: hypothetical protein A3G58_01510 [Candidatus Colwellbacteria bacterium RIFCSPLOWO2_12_FULL_46_17]